MTSIFAAVAASVAVAWLVLAVGRGHFWRTDQRLPDAVGAPALATWPAVVVIVPARDEAAVLPRTLPTLLNQDYPGGLRVVVVDDASTDGTADVVRSIAAGTRTDARVIAAGVRPDGWAGKVWAMSRGVEAAADAEYLLFTDADIAHHAASVRELVSAAVRGERDLVAQMVQLRTETAWEKLVVPAFVWFFAMLYPFRWVGQPGARTAASAGGCQLVRAAALQHAGGLLQIKGALIDDIALGRLLKRAGGRIWLGLADDVESVRAYPRLADLWAMVARGAFTQLRYSLLAVVGTVIGLALLFLVPPLATIGGAVTVAVAPGAAPVALLAAGGVAWCVMSVLYVPITRYYRLSTVRVPALPFVALLYAAMTADSARLHLLGRGGGWKGRTSSPRAPR